MRRKRAQCSLLFQRRRLKNKAHTHSGFIHPKASKIERSDSLTLISAVSLTTSPMSHNDRDHTLLERPYRGAGTNITSPPGRLRIHPFLFNLGEWDLVTVVTFVDFILHTVQETVRANESDDNGEALRHGFGVKRIGLPLKSVSMIFARPAFEGLCTINGAVPEDKKLQIVFTCIRKLEEAFTKPEGFFG